MNLTLFIPNGASQNGKALQQAIDDNLFMFNLQVIDTFNALISKLKMIYGTNNEILIFLAESHDRLKQLVTISDLLENKQIILILPDDSRESASLASRFFPRFFTPISDTYDDVCEVIYRMAVKDASDKMNNPGDIINV